jgi:hypothetical protein
MDMGTLCPRRNGQASNVQDLKPIPISSSMARLTHILFDFFGTLVVYSPDHIGQDYARSYQLLVK